VSKYTESFESYAGSIRGSTTFKDVFNHQQSKISELLERLRECEEALGFYASEHAWETPTYPNYGRRLATMHDKDVSEIIAKTGHRWSVGGKRAREYFKKYEGKNEQN
jgi:hypothetical protein